MKFIKTVNLVEKSEINIEILKKDHKEFIKNNKIILKTQQRLKIERHEIALSSDDDKRMESIDSMETYTYGISKDLVSEKEGIKCSNIIKRYQKINFDDITKGNIEKCNRNWQQIPDHTYRILIIGDSGSGKTISLVQNLFIC